MGLVTQRAIIGLVLRFTSVLALKAKNASLLGLDRIFSLQRTSKRPLQMKIELFGDFCQGRACSRRKNGLFSFQEYF